MVKWKTGALSDPDSQASDGARGLFVGKLNEVFAPDKTADNKRRNVIKFLFDVPSSKNLSKAQVGAGLEWLIKEKTPDGDYIYHDHSVEEARMIEHQMAIFKTNPSDKTLAGLENSDNPGAYDVEG